MAKRKTTRKTGKPDTGGPLPDFAPDPLYRAFLEGFLESGQMGVEFPCGTGNRIRIASALRTVAVQLALPVMIVRQATRVLVMRTTPVAPTEFPDPETALEEHLAFVKGTPIEAEREDG